MDPSCSFLLMNQSVIMHSLTNLPPILLINFSSPPCALLTHLRPDIFCMLCTWFPHFNSLSLERRSYFDDIRNEFVSTLILKVSILFYAHWSCCKSCAIYCTYCDSEKKMLIFHYQTHIYKMHRKSLLWFGVATKHIGLEM